MNNISKYNVEYHTPGKSDRSAMPLGNGETAVSVWMTEEGKLRFYMSKSDALTELERTVKLGMAEVDLGISFCKNNHFLQTLDLSKGQIRVESGSKRLIIWVDKNSDIICVKGTMLAEDCLSAKYYTWRQEPRVPVDSPVYSTGLAESADIVEMRDGNIVFYHKNGENGLAYLAKLQCIEDTNVLRDAVSNRIFGGIMCLEESTNVDMTLTKSKCKEFLLKIAVHSEQIENEEVWYEKTIHKMNSLNDTQESMQRTEEYWKQYWGKSYIYVSGDNKRKPVYTEEILSYVTEPMECTDTDSVVTRAYVLTKFMTACCKDGKFPMYYNGMLFNLCPGNGEHFNVDTFGRAFTSTPATEYPTEEINPDERPWCIEHLWQNLRLSYYALLAQGEFESLRSMFAFYKQFWELNRIRSQRYYGAKGQHNTEMTLICGLQSEQIYGKDRTGKIDGWAENRWGGAIDISPGLELLKLMLEYYRYTLDEELVYTDILPFAKDIFEYIETRFTERKDGKIVITHVNSIETYFDTTNPAPIVAGMHAVLGDILKLKELGEHRSYFEEILRSTPDIPQGEKQGKTVLLPAEEYEEKRENVESPELYAVYPFGLYGAYIGGDKTASQTFEHAVKLGKQMRPFILGETPGAPSYSGWQYIGCVAAMLGMREACEEILENNCAMQNPGNRFPAMWGPIYDAVPDTDHGANIMQTLQLMVMQCKEDKIFLMPSIPANWDVSMRLYAPYKTIVECQYEAGKLIKLHVTPKTREKDVEYLL